MDVKERFRESLKRSIPGLHYDIVRDHADYGEVCIIPAKHPDVGAMIIEVEVDDIRIHMGHLTHVHFNWYPEAQVTKEMGQTEMIREAIEFLKDVLSDRVVLWKGWWMDGSFPLDHLATIKRKRRIRYYVWSGPT